MSINNESIRRPTYDTKEPPRCGRLYCHPDEECTADNMIADLRIVLGAQIPGQDVPEAVQEVIREGCVRELIRKASKGQTLQEKQRAQD
jgi:hypothetical protein